MSKALKALAATVSAVALAFTLVACGAADSAAETAVSDTAESEAEVAPAVSEESGETTSEESKKVYFAAPLFNQSERDYNLKLVQVLEEYGYDVFLPQRDGLLAAETEGKTEEELTQIIFEKDVNAVLDADILFFNLDGRAPDEGACVELGIAYANGKRCYGMKTDDRTVEYGMDLNPMIRGCFVHLFKNHDGDVAIEELRTYLAENEL